MILSKVQSILIVLVLCLFIMLAGKLVFILRAGFTTGIVTETLTYQTKGSRFAGRMVNDIVEFNYGDSVYQFSSVQNLDYDRGDSVPVVFLKSHPEKSYIFTFWGFWWPGFIYILLPFIFLSGLLHGLMDAEDKLEISRKNFLKIIKAES